MDQFEIFAAEIDYGTDFLNVMETTRLLAQPDLSWSDYQARFRTSEKLNFLITIIRKSLKVANLVLVQVCFLSVHRKFEWRSEFNINTEAHALF